MPAQATAAEAINAHGSKQTNTQPTDSNEVTQQCDKINNSTALNRFGVVTRRLTDRRLRPRRRYAQE